MLNSIRFTFLLLFFISLSSCNSSETEKKSIEALTFIKTVETIIEKAVSPGEYFTNYFGIVAPIAKNNSNYQLDQSQIDSLYYYYTKYMSSFGRAIKKLDHLEEFDTSFSIVKSAMRSLQIMKNGYESTIPTYLYIYKIGLNSASESEKGIIMNGGKILNNALGLVHKENAILDSQTKQFIRKYKVRYQTNYKI